MKTRIPSVTPKDHSNSNYRRYIILTLSRADATPARSSLTEESIVSRITSTIPQCISMLVAKEVHTAHGHHWNVGILLTKGLHKISAARTFRKLFPEFEGDQLHVSFKRAWVTICEYIMQVDPIPFTWGQHSSLENIRDIVKAHAQHKRSPLSSRSKLSERSQLGKRGPQSQRNQLSERSQQSSRSQQQSNRSQQSNKGQLSSISIIQKLRGLSDWYEVYDDPYLLSALIPHYAAMKAIFSDLQVLKSRGSSNLQGSSSDKQSERNHLIRRKVRLRISGGTIVSFYKRGGDDD